MIGVDLLQPWWQSYNLYVSLFHSHSTQLKFSKTFLHVSLFNRDAVAHKHHDPRRVAHHIKVFLSGQTAVAEKKNVSSVYVCRSCTANSQEKI